MNSELRELIREVISILPYHPTMYSACVQVATGTNYTWKHLADAVTGDM